MHISDSEHHQPTNDITSLLPLPVSTIFQIFARSLNIYTIPEKCSTLILYTDEYVVYSWCTSQAALEQFNDNNASLTKPNPAMG